MIGGDYLEKNDTLPTIWLTVTFTSDCSETDYSEFQGQYIRIFDDRHFVDDIQFLMTELPLLVCILAGRMRGET